MPSRPDVPFPADEVDEVFLPDAPLLSVVAQVRFPVIASISRQDFIGEFQERIRSEYPTLHQMKESAFVVGPKGLSTGGEAGWIWRFRDKTDRWGVTLAPSFVALETSSYVDRPDFARRIHLVLRSLAETIAPAAIERVGLRFADRVELESSVGVVDLERLVRPEMRGPATVELGGATLTHSLNDAEFQVGEAELHARWGVLPPNAQMDPFHGEPSKHLSWLLDLDMYENVVADFDVDRIVSRTNDFARRIYAFFRWAVEDELLRRCGAAL